MSKIRRDYKAEYRRRIERGIAKGLSRTQARGHPRVGEAAAAAAAAGQGQSPGRGKQKPKKATRPAKVDQRLEEGFKALRRGASVAKAAKLVGVSRERLRRFIGEYDLANWKSRKWAITDKRLRRVGIISKGRQRDVVVPSLAEAMRAGGYWDAQGRFVRTNDISLLKPFEGEGVTDINGRFWPFETDPNELHRIASVLPPYNWAAFLGFFYEAVGELGWRGNGFRMKTY